MTGDGALRLVPLEPAHLALTRQWANDPGIARLMDRARQVSEAEHAAWFASLAGREDCRYFAIERHGRHVGNVWLWSIDPRHRKAELRIVIGDPAARGQDSGATAIDLLSRHAFEQLGLHRVYAYVLSINPAGRRAFEKAGFTLEGTLRDDRRASDRFVDCWLLARIRPDVP
ncbi:MAG: GNAT family N-acetyltransferase [Vicinamibacterales bacterium]